jgi:murein L,D-transpeptidase YcbB/YkuD
MIAASFARRAFQAALLALVLSLLPPGDWAASIDYPASVRPLVEQASAPLDGLDADERAAVRSAYAANRFEPMWHESGRLTTQALQLVAAVESAGSYGLPSEPYLRILMPYLATAPDGESIAAELDVALSAAALKLVAHLHNGRIRPADVGFHLPARGAKGDLTGALQTLSTAPNVRLILESYEPGSVHYRLLKEQLAAYRVLAQEPSLTMLPPLPSRTVRGGDIYMGAPRLRALLEAVGDLTPTQSTPVAAPSVLDEALVLAIGRFQQRHGLRPDGALGPRTYAALTTPMSQRVRQIELTMERWRWLPPLEPPLVIVNIPQFVLYALPTADAPGMPESPVIVGATEHATPIFSSAIEAVIFRPAWDVPLSIAARELVPLIRRDPGFLERNHMEIVRGQGDGARRFDPTAENIELVAAGALRIRQQPGPDNALGLIKFVLPNAYDVYLHSTPATALFGQERRALSHGCIRISEPVALARYILRNASESWSDAAIEAAMCGTETLRVKLAKPVPIMILYGTALATPSRGIMFFDDLYGHDRMLAALLGMRPAR